MIDFEKEFDDFVTSGQGGSAITDVYDILPSLDPRQLMLLHTITYYAQKYDLPELFAFIETYKRDMSKNKNLSFLGTMNIKQLLKAYTMEDYVKGVNVSSVNKTER